MKSTFVCALLVFVRPTAGSTSSGHVPEAGSASGTAASARADPFGNLKGAVLPTAFASLTCTELLRSYQTLECPFAAADSESGPPRLMPKELTAAYTLNGAVPTASFFVDDSNSSHVRTSVLGMRRRAWKD